MYMNLFHETILIRNVTPSNYPLPLLRRMDHYFRSIVVVGIPKLEDANEAGTRNSVDCTLILTEGDSAKSLAVSGLGVIGRDRYGVFPLRGKLLNVREASHKQVSEISKDD